MTEEQIISGLEAKNTQVFSYFYDHYSAAVLGIIQRIIPEREIAEDLLHDVFLKVWTHFDQYDSSKGRLFTWLAQMARNKAIDYVRSPKYSKTSSIQNGAKNVSEKNYGEQVLPGEDKIGLTELVKQLKEDQRIIIEHLYFKGLTQEETAEELSIPLGTVKTRTRSALKQFRTWFKTQQLE